MKSKMKVLFKIFSCLMVSIAMFITIFNGHLTKVFAEESDTLKPTIISVCGRTVEGSVIGIPNAMKDEEYKSPTGERYKIVAEGSGVLTYTAYEDDSGTYNSMPAGLHLDKDTGEFYGTITVSGTVNFTITVSNEYGSTSVLVSLGIFLEEEKPVITTTSLPKGAVGSYYNQTIEFTGYRPDSYTVEIISGSLPTGLASADTYAGVKIHGKPTEAGSFTFTVSINTGVGVVTKEYTIEIIEEITYPSFEKREIVINEEDKYSYIDESSKYIYVIQGKPVSIQLVCSGTNTVDNPIIFSMEDELPEGLTLSESGLITGTPADSIEIDGSSKYYYGIDFEIKNKAVDGSNQSTTGTITMVVCKNGAVQSIDINPSETSVTRGGERQFEIIWSQAYGDYDKNDVTWKIDGKPSSSETSISNAGLLKVGIDETYNTLRVRVTHNASGSSREATVKLIDHTHNTIVVDEVEKTCTTDGNIKHYKCTECGQLFEDAIATKNLTNEKVIIKASHEYGTLVSKQSATCSNPGKEAHYECLVCHTLFNSAKEEKTESELEIAIDPTAHKFGTWQNEVEANCGKEGMVAHKDCEYCNKHFDSEGVEITNIVIGKNDDHLLETDWTKDESSHWHVCSREGCKDSGKVDVAAHTKNAEEATETNDVHCTICEYVITPAKTHSHGLETHYGYTNTCTKDGSKTYYECSSGDNPCGKYFEDKEATKEIVASELETWKRIPSQHTFGDWVDGSLSNCGETGVVAHKTCTVCNKYFDAEDVEIKDIVIPKNDDHIVTDNETWESDQYGHWHVCSREGCKNNGKAEYTEHTKSSDNATETNDIHCIICSFIIEPVKGHVHELTKIDGYDETCTTDGSKTYYECSLGDHTCGKYFEDEEGTKEITASRLNAWKTIPAHHTFGEWIDEVLSTTDTFGVKGHKDCSVCNKHFDAYDNELTDLKIDKLTPVIKDDDKDPVTKDDNKKKSLSGGAIALIICGSIIICGVGGFAIVWFIIKKKNMADLKIALTKIFKKNK